MVARRAHNPEVVRFKSHLRNQKENHPSGWFFFLRFGLGFEHSLPPPTKSVGGSGIGARALAERDEARATREKIRSIGWAPPRTHPRRLYFRVGLSNPTSATKKRFHSRSGFDYGILLYMRKAVHFCPFTAHFGGFERGFHL